MSQLHSNKKRSIALAGVALLGTLSFGASANDGKPSVYGRIHVALQKSDIQGASAQLGNNATVRDQWEVVSNNSRLGIKGALDVSDSGISVIYLAEYGLNADGTGTNVFTKRNIYGGVQSKYGTLTVGYNDTPLKLTEGRVDQFNDILSADLDALLGGQNRVENLITYTSPSFSHVTVKAAFAPGEGTDVDGDGKADKGLGDSYSSSLVFDNKTFYAALAYDSNIASRRGLDLTSSARVKAIRAVGKLTLKDWEAGILLQKTQGADSSGSGTVSDGKLNDRSALLNVAYSINQYKIKAQFGYTQGDESREKSQLVALGFDYALSNKTLIHTYATYQTWKDVTQTKLKDTVLGVSLEHNF